MNRELQSPSQAHDTAGEAVFPGKEAWKNGSGNRYTPEELREMERNWKIRITDPTFSRIPFLGDYASWGMTRQRWSQRE